MLGTLWLIMLCYHEECVTVVARFEKTQAFGLENRPEYAGWVALMQETGQGVGWK
jgi:hypothetical protein